MRIIVHIGFHKCASTSLQRLFEESDEIFYLGKYNNSPKRFLLPEITTLITDEIFHLADEEFNYKYPSGIGLQWIETLFGQLSESAIILLSEEDLTGLGVNLISGAGLVHMKSITRLERIFSCKPDVYLVYRDPYKFVFSYYQQMVTGKKLFMSYEDFIRILPNERAFKEIIVLDEFVAEIRESGFNVIMSAFDDIVSRSRLAGEMRKIGIKSCGELPRLNVKSERRTSVAERSLKNLRKPTYFLRNFKFYKRNYRNINWLFLPLLFFKRYRKHHVSHLSRLGERRLKSFIESCSRSKLL